MGGDLDRQAIVEQHLGYVRALASEIARSLPSGIDFEDLVGFGTTGLLEAAQRYDPNRGAVFTTFAYYRIRGAIYDGLRKMATLSRRAWERVKLLDSVDGHLEAEGARMAAGAAPSDRMAALTALKETLGDVVTMYLALEAGVEDRAVSPEAPTDDRIGQAQSAARVRAAIGELPEKERQLLTDHYFGDLTLEQAGAKMGLSKSWASRLHARAVRRLREVLASE